jgi:hypothetical protein
MQAAAVDELFPEHPYQDESLIKYIEMVTRSRLKHVVEEGDKRYLLQLLKDLKSVPRIWRMLQDKTRADLLTGSASWGHKNLSQQTS